MSSLSYDNCIMNQQLVLREPDLTALKFLFQAMSNETRLRIMNLLRRGPRNVGEISAALKLEQTVVSHNLKCLDFCGLVSVQQLGKERVYSLNRATVEPLLISGDRHIARFATNLRTCECLER
jgi:DNA-binding transcriptional ArsR family regulator